MWVNQKCTSYWGNILMVDKGISAGKHILHDTWILILASHPQTLAECHWEVFCVAPYSGLLVFGQLWLGAIYNFLKRWTVVTHPNGTGMFLCYGFLSPPILVRISKLGQEMHFSTVKIPVNLGLDWPWTSPSFLIPKLIFFALWRCALRLWNSPWFVSILFRDCFTVSTPVHMGNIQPKWNGASSAGVLNLN